MLEEFPYYQDLDAIWSGIPSFDCELISSDPNINSVGSLVEVVKSKNIHTGTIHTVLEEEPEQEDDEAGPEGKESATVWGFQDNDVHMDDVDDGFAGLYDDPPMTFDSEPSAQPTSMVRTSVGCPSRSPPSDLTNPSCSFSIRHLGRPPSLPDSVPQ